MEPHAQVPIGDSAIMRRDLEQSLRRQSIHPLTLSAFQRILLTTDGTVTDILEAFSGESIRVIKLFQETRRLDHAVAALELPWGEPVLRRSILLQGRMSLVNFIHAESVIALDRLSERVRGGLLQTSKGIGQLFLENRIESFRAILDCGTERAGPLAGHFSIDEDASLLYRTYNIISNGQPVIVITEKFPEAYFREWDPTSIRGGAPMQAARQARRSETGGDAHTHQAVVSALEQFVRRELLQDRAPETITPTTDLLVTGLVAPSQFFPLIAFIRERFAVRFEEHELVADNFRHLTAIADGILSRLGPPASV
jgi:chorismate-pyruvate lyase